MTLFEKSLLLADFVGFGGFIIALVLFLKNETNIKNVKIFFLIWAAAFLFEYYFLGENSYIVMDDEGDFFPPFYSYLINRHLGGQFGHHIAGGTDIYTAWSPSIQLISPELIWMKYFPMWIAILIHKTIVVTVGFWGSYILCRRTTTADTLICAAAGAFFTVSTNNLIIVTYSIGSSLAFLPAAIYVFVIRSNQSNYWRYAIPTAIMIGIYLDITHAAELMFAGIGIAAIIFGYLNTRVFASLFILLVATLINWAEPIYAMMQMVPLTNHGSEFDLRELTERLYDAISIVIARTSENRVTFLAFAIIFILWLQKDAMWKRAAIGIFGIIALYTILYLFPFQKIGLGALGNLSHHYILLAITGIMLIPMAHATAALSQAPYWPFKRYPNANGAILLAIAVGMLIHFKVYNFANLMYHGGQSQYRSVLNWPDADWRSKSPSRVITLRVRDLGPEPALAYGMYGLEALDVYQMLETKQRSLYYGLGILGEVSNFLRVDPRLFVDWSEWRGGLYHGIGKQVSFDHLRLINTGYILSPIPFAKENGLRLVSGPKRPPLTKFDRTSQPIEYIKERFDRLFDFPELYIYALDAPYPQVFAATRSATISDQVDDKTFILMLSDEMKKSDYVATVRSSQQSKLGNATASLRITKFEKIRDGFHIETSAPDGGIVVVNTAYLPFWTATADGKLLEIVPVNFIQMGVQIPPGTQTVTFSYHRPDVSDLLEQIGFK